MRRIRSTNNRRRAKEQRARFADPLGLGFRYRIVPLSETGITIVIKPGALWSEEQPA